jgi:hypothetical protein
MNPYLIGGAAIAFLLSLGGSYLYGRHDGRQIEIAAQAREDQAIEKVRAAALEGAAEAISKIEVKRVTIRQQLDREIIEKPVYRDCRHTADGMRAINEARTGEVQPPPDRSLPTPDTPPG